MNSHIQYPDLEASLFAGILLGVESGISEEVERSFQDSGRAHIVAISGFIQIIMDHEDVHECPAELFCPRGVPIHLRSDNGPEFIANQSHQWFNRLGVQTMIVEPGNPWENGYVESFNGKLLDELLNRVNFYPLQKAKIPIEHWRRQYNQVRPHSALGYRPPDPEAVLIPTITAALHTGLPQTLTYVLVQSLGAGQVKLTVFNSSTTGFGS